MCAGARTGADDCACVHAAVVAVVFVIVSIADAWCSKEHTAGWSGLGLAWLGLATEEVALPSIAKEPSGGHEHEQRRAQQRTARNKEVGMACGCLVRRTNAQDGAWSFAMRVPKHKTQAHGGCFQRGTGGAVLLKLLACASVM